MHQGPVGLAAWLEAWWTKAVSRLAKGAPADAFLRKLVDYFKTHE